LASLDVAPRSSNLNIETIYALSPMQEGLLFHALLAPESAVYFEQVSCRLRDLEQPQSFIARGNRPSIAMPLFAPAFIGRIKSVPCKSSTKNATFPGLSWTGVPPRRPSSARASTRWSKKIVAAALTYPLHR